jgi:uncharacterized protein (DUF2164 family)
LQRTGGTRWSPGSRIIFPGNTEEEIGDLAAGLLLDFIIENLAPDFYNQGVDDAYRFMKEAAEDLLSIRT